MLRILLIEDSAMLAERLLEALGQLNDIEVVGTVATEVDAIRAIQSQALDLLILDLQLRQGTGFGVLRAIGRPRPVVIVLTNYALPEYRQRAKELGVEHFLNKSLDYERLPEVIATVQAQLAH